MSRTIFAWSLTLLAGAAALALAGQQPPAATPPPSAAATGAAGAQPPGDENMLEEGEVIYRHLGDRDPFTPLVRGSQGVSDVIIKKGSTGLARFTVESCSLEVIVRTSGTTAAWFQGPDSKPYKAAVGDRFADGVIIEISYEGGAVIVQQELNDPTAIKPYRNLPLRIRSEEGEGQ